MSRTGVSGVAVGSTLAIGGEASGTGDESDAWEGGGELGGRGFIGGGGFALGAVALELRFRNLDSRCFRESRRSAGGEAVLS